MKKIIVYISVVFLFISCQSQNSDQHVKPTKERSDSTSIQSTKSFKSYFNKDSTLTKKNSINILTISNGTRTEEIAAICNCDKNVEKNTIDIQITVAIPTKAELEKGVMGGRTFMGLSGQDSLMAQLRFLTFYLKDSTVQKIQLYSKAVRNIFNNSDFKYSNISKYHIRISKFDYSIASNVFGTYKVILPEPFGYFKQDTILVGRFECNNWRINTLESIKNWDLKEFYKSRGGGIP